MPQDQENTTSSRESMSTCAQHILSSFHDSSKHECTPLRMRHHGQVTAIGRTESCNAVRRAIGVVRIRSCGPAMYRVSYRGQLAFEHLFHHVWVWEETAPFPVCHPDAHITAAHALEHDGWAVEYLHCRPAAFKTLCKYAAALQVTTDTAPLPCLPCEAEPKQHCHS
jgi:hypothetical protein